MKKLLLTIGCALGVVAGALLIWYAVIPAISGILNWMFGALPALFA